MTAAQIGPDLRLQTTQKFVPLLYEPLCNSVRLDWISKSFKQSCVFQSNLIFPTFCAIFRLEYSICVLSRQRCACASIFSRHIFCVFSDPNC